MIIEVLPAGSGDSIIISFDKNSKQHMIIDCGFKDTYQNYLVARLNEYAQQNHRINLLVITHIDKDHIGGALELFRLNGFSHSPQLIEIEDVWHNSYRHLELFDGISGQNTKEFYEILKGIIFNGSSIIKKGLGKISAFQGSMLASLIFENEYNWNRHHNGRAVAFNENEKITIDDDIEIIILSPRKESLEKLKRKWKKELRKKKFDFKFEEGKLFDDAYEFFMLRQDSIAYFAEDRKISASDFSMESIKKIDIDSSETNESSIAFILEYKNNKLLFLGDSNPMVIESSLLELVNKENYDMHFDIVKVSHHGSLRNTTEELLNIISSSKWIISGNGEHGNPDIDTIKLILRKNKGIMKQLYFNYSPEWLSILNVESLKSEYKYEIIAPVNGDSLSIELGENSYDYR